MLRIKPDGASDYGPDIVDRWKARAFAQDPGSETPCCGYEEEDTNWGGSSTLLGERVGPVRAIRETWGADSGTNVIRQEIFYRGEMRQKTWLRVHVIPPLDGIYAQWDFNAGKVDRFYNSRNPAGVPIDGSNDEAFGNLDDPCNPKYDANDTSQLDQTYRTLYAQFMGCQLPYHLSIDVTDPTFSDPNVLLGLGRHERPVRQRRRPHHVRRDGPDAGRRGAVAGGRALLPRRLVLRRRHRLRSGAEAASALRPTSRRRQRRHAARAAGIRPTAIRPGSDHFYQGSIGTHGLHLLFQVDSDNARLTEPVDEIVSDWRMVMLPGRADATAGEQYGRGFEKPLLPVVADRNFASRRARASSAAPPALWRGKRTGRPAGRPGSSPPPPPPPTHGSATHHKKEEAPPQAQAPPSPKRKHHRPKRRHRRA